MKKITSFKLQERIILIIDPHSNFLMNKTMLPTKLTYKELEERLNHSTQNLNDTQTLSLVGSWNWNLTTNKTAWSDMMFILLGLKPNEILPSYELALDHVYQEDKERYEQILSEAVSQKKPFLLENKLVKKDGSIISVISRGMCFMDDEDNLIRMIGTVQDITEQKRKEELLQEQKIIISDYTPDLEQEIRSRTKKLRESESKLLQAQQTAKLGIWEWNLQTEELVWSDQMYENYGLAKDILVTMDLFFKHIHPEDLEYVNKVIGKTLKKGIPPLLKYRIITPKGEIKSMHGITEQILDESGDIIKLVGTLQDISAQEKAEYFQSQLEAVLQGQEMERERIAAELHDGIKPLLSIASLNLESLLDGNEYTQDFKLEKLENSISILEDAIDTVNEISRNLSPAILNNFGLEKAFEQFCNKIREAGIVRVDFSVFGLEERLDPKVELALYRIGQELLNNIIKHADATKLDIQIVCHPKSLIMMVSDDGNGFDTSIKELKTSGFGFRNITYRVHTLNGEFNIDSSKGKGATIIIELPIPN